MKQRAKQLIAQWGEHLACTELNRRGFFSTPFAGNLPEIDILCCDENLRTIPIQVKAFRGNSFPSTADKYMDVEFDKENRQIVKPKKDIPNPDLIYLLIKLGGEYGQDEFYLLRKKDLFVVQYNYYRDWLKKYDNLRPNKPRSLHCSVMLKYLKKYKDNWDVLR